MAAGPVFTRLMAIAASRLGRQQRCIMSEKPCEIEEHVHRVGANPDERAQFARRAAEDWEKILLARAAEMQEGARFIVLNFGIDEKGRFLGNTGGHSMFDKFNDHWRALLNAGKITRDEFRRATFVQHYRTVEEFEAPFADSDGAVSKSGLRLKSSRTQLTQCPYYRAFQASEGAMSAADYAASLIPTMRSWSNRLCALDALSGRSAGHCRRVFKYEDEVAQNPEGHDGLYSRHYGD